MPKTKKVIDNAWLKDGLFAYDMTQADLSNATGITQDKINKSVKNRRGISGEEYRAIMSVFEAKKAGMPIFNPSLRHNPVTRSPASIAEEGDMIREGGLWDVIGDLTRRIAKLEQQSEVEKEKPATGPQKRRKG